MMQLYRKRKKVSCDKLWEITSLLVKATDGRLMDAYSLQLQVRPYAAKIAKKMGRTNELRKIKSQLTLSLKTLLSVTTTTTGEFQLGVHIALVK